MKKTCDGCKALQGVLPWEQYCTLNFKTKIGESILEPAEECPKPRTFKALCDMTLKSDKK